MPLFTYICRNDHTHTVVRKNSKLPAKCPECGAKSNRLFNAVRISAFTPYMTDHGGGPAEEIRTVRQEDSYCKRHGVARMLDSEQFDFAQSERIRNKRSRDALESESFEESVQAVQRIETEF